MSFRKAACTHMVHRIDNPLLQSNEKKKSPNMRAGDGYGQKKNCRRNLNGQEKKERKKTKPILIVTGPTQNTEPP